VTEIDSSSFLLPWCIGRADEGRNAVFWRTYIMAHFIQAYGLSRSDGTSHQFNSCKWLTSAAWLTHRHTDTITNTELFDGYNNSSRNEMKSAMI